MKKHRTDSVSLVFGVIFLVVVGWWLLGRTISIGLPTLGWVVAVALIVLGGLGLLAALRGNREPANHDAGPDHDDSDPS
jgi:uncharacterized membrane protein HdeD (DUF308 family)